MRRRQSARRKSAGRSPPGRNGRRPLALRHAIVAWDAGSSQRGPHGVQGTRVFRRAADRQPAPRQLSRRDRQVRRAAEAIRLHLLRGRPARHHGVAGPGGAAAQYPRGDGRVHRLRHRPETAHRLQPEPGGRARGARLGVQLRRPHRLAQPHDAVQGKGRQGPRERVGRAVRLSEPDGRRHPGLSGDPRAGRRGPEAASRAGARHRAEIQQRLRRLDPRARLRRRLLPAAPSR